MIVLWIGVLIASLFVLIRSADYFTKYSEKLGLIFGMSSFIIGATIIAIGTSLPELVSSLFAISAGETEFVTDNIIGSNIANGLLILGIGAVVAGTLKASTKLIDVDLPFFFMSMALFVFFAMDKVISFPEGIALFVFFVIFMIYNIRSGSEGNEEEKEEKEQMKELKEQFENGTEKKHRKSNVRVYIAIIVASMIAIAVGAKFLIDSVLTLSQLLGISSSLLTITVVAFGTSLPEVLTSISAIRLGNHGMAIGNVFGSNTFNLLLVGGLPALFKDLTIHDSTFSIGIPFLVVATFTVIFVIFDNKIRFWEGVAMLFLYAVFIAKIIQIL
ncbi:conjugal transfer protein TraR [Candidatus Wolfebacteria bacterium]|nr:MAG: conjugal transfer protein TraR [Candidatus Wolfebacteria bacterium]